ncbi:MAG: FlgD immunoglobulin-like domain containing protein [Bacteroidota bacterium]
MRFISILLIAVGLCSFCLMYSHQNKIQKTTKNKNTSNAPYGIGEANDRATYEYKRLANPTTGKIPANIRSKELQFAATLPKNNEGSRSVSWMSRGPNNFGGRTRAIGVDIANENILLAASVTGGIFRSTNGGALFTQTLTPAQLKSATCLAQDIRSGHTSTWYCGTGEFYGINSIASFSNLASGNGIYKSTNNGVSWTLIPSTVSNTPTTHLTLGDFDVVWDIVCDKTNSSQDVVLAAVYGGIYRSTDGGTSWTAVLGLDTVGGVAEYVDLKQTPSGIFYATLSSTSIDKGIWRSIDGINWINITPAGFASTYDRMELAYAPSDEAQIYMIANTPGTGSNAHQLWHYQYVSGDGSGAGGTWQNRTTHLPDEHCTGFFTFDFAYYSSQSSYDMCIAVKPDDPNFVLLGGTNIYRSTDGFTTDNYKWIGGYQCDTIKHSNYVWPNHHPDQHMLLFKNSNANYVYSTNDGGIYASSDITIETPLYISLNNSHKASQFYTVAIEPGNASSKVIVGGLQDNGTEFTASDNASVDWKHVFYGDGAFCAITRNRTNYYLSYQSGKVFKFEIQDDGTVLNLTRIDPTTGSGYDFINPFILDPSNDNVMYLCGGKNIWRNDSLNYIPVINDEYNTLRTGWKKLINTSTGIGFSSPSLSALAMGQNNSLKLYFGTDNGQIYVLDTASSTTCAKRLISNSSMPTGAYVSAISVDQQDANKVIASFSNYGIKSIFYSSDAGANWQDVSGNLEQNPDGSGDGPSINWIHIYHDADTTIYFAGTSVGLFSTSVLNGTSTIWTQEGASTIGNISVNMITSRTYDGTVVIGTHGNGVYSMQLKSSVGIASAENLFMSAQVYPNPMKEQTQIDFTLSNEVEMSITVYSIYGDIIKHLVDDQEMKAGHYQMSWDGKNDQGNMVSNGQYYIVLQDREAHRKTLKTIKYN